MNLELLKTHDFTLCCVGWRFYIKRVISHVSKAMRLILSIAWYAIDERSWTEFEMLPIAIF